MDFWGPKPRLSLYQTSGGWRLTAKGAAGSANGTFFLESDKVAMCRLRRFGQRFPVALAVMRDVLVGPDGAFSVLDGNGSRIAHFDANGELRTSIQGPGTSVGYPGFRVALAWPDDMTVRGLLTACLAGATLSRPPVG